MGPLVKKATRGVPTIRGSRRERGVHQRRQSFTAVSPVSTPVLAGNTCGQGVAGAWPRCRQKRGWAPLTRRRDPLAPARPTAPAPRGTRLVVAEERGDGLGVLAKARRVEGARHKAQLARLLGERAHYRRVRVPLVHGGVAGERVQVALAIHVPYVHALRALDDHRHGGVVVRRHARLARDGSRSRRAQGRLSHAGSVAAQRQRCVCRRGGSDCACDHDAGGGGRRTPVGGARHDGDGATQHGSEESPGPPAGSRAGRREGGRRGVRDVSIPYLGKADVASCVAPVAAVALRSAVARAASVHAPRVASRWRRLRKASRFRRWTWSRPKRGRRACSRRRRRHQARLRLRRRWLRSRRRRPLRTAAGSASRAPRWPRRTQTQSRCVMRPPSSGSASGARRPQASMRRRCAFPELFSRGRLEAIIALNYFVLSLILTEYLSLEFGCDTRPARAPATKVLTRCFAL